MIQTSELWACTGCGGVFIPGQGPDDIMADDDPDSPYGAFRDGPCPSCGELNPPMQAVRTTGEVHP